MTFGEALEIMKRGGTVTRGGRCYRIGRGVEDVTKPGEVLRADLGTIDREADDWQEIPELASAETVDEVLKDGGDP